LPRTGSSHDVSAVGVYPRDGVIGMKQEGQAAPIDTGRMQAK
jgi:hypothetical protein